MKEFCDYSDIINELSSLRERSDEIIEEGVLEKDFILFRNECLDIYKTIIKKGINPTLTEISISGLNLRVVESKNPIVRFFLNLFNGKTASNRNEANFLDNHSKFDNYRKYVLWTKLKLESLIYNLDKESKMTN